MRWNDGSNCATSPGGVGYPAFEFALISNPVERGGTAVNMISLLPSRVCGPLMLTDWGVRIDDDRRELQNDGSREKVTGVASNVTWRLAPRTSIGVDARWEESTFADEPDRGDTIVRLGASLSHDLGRDADVSLVYSYRDRDSTVEDLDFNENWNTAILSKVS